MDAAAQQLDQQQRRFAEHGVPWDPAVLGRAKQSTLGLCRRYLDAILGEVVYLEGSKATSAHGGATSAEARMHSLLVSAVRFAFRVHQFVGGFDPECVSRFEAVSVKLKQHPAPQA